MTTQNNAPAMMPQTTPPEAQLMQMVGGQLFARYRLKTTILSRKSGEIQEKTHATKLIWN